jgi:hypothetical protein
LLVATIVMIALQSRPISSLISDSANGVMVRVTPQQSEGAPALFLRPL